MGDRTLERTRALALTGVTAAVIAVSAWISLPFYPVPLTMQTLAVLVAGGLLGPVWGPMAVAVYLFLGAIGLPVFHGGLAGLGVLFGPTGGYLVGFLPAVFVMGAAGAAARRAGLARRRSLVLLILGAVAASLAIYAVGVPWLMWVRGLDLRTALAGGAFPFLLGDAVKAALAVAVTRSAGRVFAAGS